MRCRVIKGATPDADPFPMQGKMKSVKRKGLVVLSVPLLVLLATTALTFRALKQSEETEGRVRHAYYVKDRIQRVHLATTSPLQAAGRYPRSAALRRR